MTHTQVQEKLGHNIPLIITPAPELSYQAAQNNRPMILQQPESLTAKQYYDLANIVLL